MKNTKAVLAAISMVTTLSMAPAAFAQHPGLVHVDIRNVAGNIAKNIYVRVRDIPPAVDVNPNVASKVCQVPVEAFAAEKSGTANCVAKITVPGLDQIVEWQIKHYTHP